MKCPYCNGTGELIGDDESVGACVMSMRKMKKLTQAELAEKSAISRGQLANFETGRTDMPLRTLARIAAGLGCSMKDLIP